MLRNEGSKNLSQATVSAMGHKFCSAHLTYEGLRVKKKGSVRECLLSPRKQLVGRVIAQARGANENLFHPSGIRIH